MDECAICMEEMTKDAAILIPCQHQFCLVCIEKWFDRKVKCPTCISNVFELKVSPQDVHYTHRIVLLPQANAKTIGVNLSSSVNGIQVTTVISNSIASKAGIRCDDLIVRVNGIRCRNINTFTDIIKQNLEVRKMTVDLVRQEDLVMDQCCVPYMRSKLSSGK